MSLFRKEYKLPKTSYEEVMDEDELIQISKNVLEWALQGNIMALEKHLAHLWVRDLKGATPLHYAVSKGHVHIIRLIAQVSGAQELNVVDEDGNTALHWAVQKKQLESCSSLMSLKANPNILNNSLQSPLHLAVSLGCNALVEELVSHSQTDVNLEGDLGNTPVMVACSVDNHEALHVLFRYGAKFCSQNKLGHFPIHAAAFAGARKSMQVILERGEEMGHSTEAHINYVDKSCCSPLHLAVRGGNLEIIKLCLGNGAKIIKQQCDKSTALHCACIQGATEAVKVMLSAFDNVNDIINIADGADQTPLHKAALFDHNDLAEFLLSKGANINIIDCKGQSPLLLATSCGAWKTVSLLLSQGCDFRVKDNCGCNFLHLAILQPHGLRNLPAEILQHESVRELLSDEDNEGCTPLHYACKLGIPDSVKNMLGLEVSLEQKSKQKKSALHFAAEYGRINTCQRLLENMTDTRLVNEGDEKGMTPLHLASHGGHVQVVELLLRKGALFHSDYKGWSCLHHAAAEGYTQTMDTILSSNIKLLDKMDEDGNTALHLAAREGHAAAVKLLLSRGAQFLLNKCNASFVHEAVHNSRKEATNVVIQSGRCAEALMTFNVDSSKGCAVRDMIEFLPESFKCLLDTCIKESDDDVNSQDYWIEYNFEWLQAPIKYVKNAQKNNKIIYQPLAAMNAMVNYNRLELLTHPVCKKYLEMKWNAYGMKVHLFNMMVYTLGLFPLTHLILNLRPTFNSTSTHVVKMATSTLDKQCPFITFCMFLVLAMNLYAVGKELVQIWQKRRGYLYDPSNMLDWSSAVFSIAFVVPLLLDVKSHWHWQAGSIAVLISWVNFLLYLQRFERFGIYVVMFREIAKTLMSIGVLFFYLILAFSLSFYALMINQVHFSGLFISIMQSFVMMVGELNHQENFLKPYLNESLPFPNVTCFIFIWFVFFVPILLMNLLIGLAVGDIAEVQKNATLKQIGMQIDLHTNLEEKLPYWFMKRADMSSLKIHPNRQCARKRLFLLLLFGEEIQEVRTRICNNSHKDTPMEQELARQKSRMKDIACVLEKQHNLLKLIVQKMEISAESEDSDGPRGFKIYRERLLTKQSKWLPLLKAVTAHTAHRKPL
ncbi:transient receptor potential cation channel subfamily A member 1a [Denticeps clupeoides]|uniref:transient receptor potential cation channel subfamily A member 1a n=1 Tax=Denticeps clupeoides TaxID=299321 RepID=UPI0010A3C923|nr:transient receptor potential cation channel subfamily A member 1-like [Denticeps clupeoides]